MSPDQGVRSVRILVGAHKGRVCKVVSADAAGVIVIGPELPGHSREWGYRWDEVERVS
jgi:hypothetical protein